MARSYSLPTVKTLFGQASGCAYPDCNTPLILTARGKSSVIAEIAHIRFESALGPRHEPEWVGEVDGAENLLLLCRNHHKPVDDHESVYTVDELIDWKRRQTMSAGDGTPLSDDQARSLIRLSPEQRAAVTEVARLGYRIEAAYLALRVLLAEVEAGWEAKRADANRGMPIYEVLDDGSKKRVLIEPSHMERQGWQSMLDEVYGRERGTIDSAVVGLGEEVAVLRMTDPALNDAATRLMAVAGLAVDSVRSAGGTDEFIDRLRLAVQGLYDEVAARM